MNEVFDTCLKAEPFEVACYEFVAAHHGTDGKLQIMDCMRNVSGTRVPIRFYHEKLTARVPIAAYTPIGAHERPATRLL